MTPQEIYYAAEKAAIIAAQMQDATLPPEVIRGLDCGFAWVEVRPAKGEFIKWCKANDKGSKHWKSGWQFWCPGQANTQSISVHEAGAKAFAMVLAKHGISASYHSRLD